eukprot:5001504-Lingulodinium_polyedra.AAC.1
MANGGDQGCIPLADSRATCLRTLPLDGRLPASGPDAKNGTETPHPRREPGRIGVQSLGQSITASNSTRWFLSDKLTLGPRARRYRA